MKNFVIILFLSLSFSSFSQNSKISALPNTATLLDNDLLLITRPSTSVNYNFTKQDLETFIQNLTTTSEFDTVTVLNGTTESIGLGASATYNSWDILFSTDDGTNTFTGNIKPIYNNSSADVACYTGVGDIPANYPTFNMEQAVVAAGQYYWKITNNSGNDVKVTYRVTQIITF